MYWMTAWQPGYMQQACIIDCNPGCAEGLQRKFRLCHKLLVEWRRSANQSRSSTVQEAKASPGGLSKVFVSNTFHSLATVALEVYWLLFMQMAKTLTELMPWGGTGEDLKVTRPAFESTFELCLGQPVVDRW